MRTSRFRLADALLLFLLVLLPMMLVLGAFTQVFDGSTLDASALVLPLVGFLSPIDPRVQSTVRLIQERLTTDGLVYRYLTDDGVPAAKRHLRSVRSGSWITSRYRAGLPRHVSCSCADRLREPRPAAG